MGERLCGVERRKGGERIRKGGNDEGGSRVWWKCSGEKKG